MLSRLELSLFSPPVLCRHAELWRTALKWYNLWQTPNWWANGQTNKLASPLCGQSSPTPDLSDPPGHPVPAVTVSSLKVWEVVGLLFLTSFRAFNSQLTIQASVPLICKYQHAAPPHASVCLSCSAFLSVCARRLLELQVFRQRRVTFNPAFVPVGSDGRVHTCSRSQNKSHSFNFIPTFPSCICPWILVGRMRTSK